jgi:integrase
VRLRPLTRAEQRVLRAKLRDLKLPARRHRRYQIVAAARKTASVPAVAQRVGCNVTTAYHWVARFNTSGFSAFERPSNPRGRIPIVTVEQLRELMDVALSSPRERGLPFSVWSVPKLAAYCREHDLIGLDQFLFFSAWRVGEVRTLQWRDYDRHDQTIRLRPEHGKNKHARLLPLVGELAAVIDRRLAVRRLDCGFIFHREGEPIGDFRSSGNERARRSGYLAGWYMTSAGAASST